jgi:hypothetical protein
MKMSDLSEVARGDFKRAAFAGDQRQAAVGAGGEQRVVKARVARGDGADHHVAGCVDPQGVVMKQLQDELGFLVAGQGHRHRVALAGEEAGRFARAGEPRAGALVGPAGVLERCPERHVAGGTDRRRRGRVDVPQDALEALGPLRAASKRIWPDGLIDTTPKRKYRAVSSPGADWPLRARGAVGRDGTAARARGASAAQAMVVAMKRRAGTIDESAWVGVIGVPPRASRGGV